MGRPARVRDGIRVRLFDGVVRARVQENGGGTVFHVVGTRLSKLARGHLGKLGSTVSSSTRGERGDEALRGDRWAIDVIFIDIDKPG